MKASEVIAELEGRRGRSAWDRGVTSCAVGMLEELGPGAELAPGGVREALLDGAAESTPIPFTPLRRHLDGVRV